MRSRAMDDDSNGAADDTKVDPDYAFDGFEVIFSRKVALMAPSPAPAPALPRKDVR